MANNTVRVTDNMAFVRLLLTNACPANVEGGIFTFYLETHCVAWWVEATKDEDDRWVVLSMRSEPC